MQVVLLTRQDKIIGRRDGALESVTKAAIVFAKTSSRHGLGDGSRRFQDQGSAKFLKFSLMLHLE